MIFCDQISFYILFQYFFVFLVKNLEAQTIFFQTVSTKPFSKPFLNITDLGLNCQVSWTHRGAQKSYRDTMGWIRDTIWVQKAKDGDAGTGRGDGKNTFWLKKKNVFIFVLSEIEKYWTSCLLSKSTTNGFDTAEKRRLLLGQLQMPLRRRTDVESRVRNSKTISLKYKHP